MRTYYIGQYKVEFSDEIFYISTEISLKNGYFLLYQNSDTDWWTLYSKKSGRYINFNNGVRPDNPAISINANIELSWTNGRRGFEIYHDNIRRTTYIEKFDNFCSIIKTFGDLPQIRYRTNDNKTIIFGEERFSVEGRFDFEADKEERIAIIVKELKFSEWKKVIRKRVLLYKEKRRKMVEKQLNKYLVADLIGIVEKYVR